jgi:hypothetical protein
MSRLRLLLGDQLNIRHWWPAQVERTALRERAQALRQRLETL